LEGDSFHLSSIRQISARREPDIVEGKCRIFENRLRPNGKLRAKNEDSDSRDEAKMARDGRRPAGPGISLAP
jgi:hypothetical protein